MIKCPNKNLPEWLELERVVPNRAYTIWDNNNGNGIDKAPNGEPSKLFSDLLEHFNGDRDATILAKSKIYSNAFKTWFGDWEKATNSNRVSLGKEIPNTDEYSKYGQKGETDVEIREVLDENDNIIGTVRMEFSGKGRKGVVTLHPNLTVTGKGYGTALYQHIADIYNINVEESFGEIGKSEAAKKLWNKIANTISKDPDIPLRQLTPSNSSKVVDENGEPLVVYHGTQTKFTEFSKEKRGTYTGATSAKLAFFAASNKLNSGAYAKLEDLTTAIDKLKKAQTFDINLKLEDIGAVDDISDLDIIGQEYFNTITGIQGSYYSLANDYAIYLNSKGESRNIKQTLTINQAEEWVTDTDLNDYKNDGFIITPEQQEAYKRGESIEIVKSTTTPLDGYDVFKRFKENNEFTKAHKEEINRYFNDIKEADKKHEQSYKEFIASKAETTPYILPLFLNIKNPKIDDDKGKEYRAISYAERISDALQEGKDGGVIKNTKDPFDTDVYYFFEPNQIKSIDNVGTFNKSDIIYEKSDNFHEISLEATIKRLSDILGIDNTSDLINYINGLLNVSEYTKLLLTKLLSKSTKVIIDWVLNKIASYDGNLILYKNRLSYASNQILAEDIAHEMLHHYFSKLYDTDSKFRSEITDLRELFKTKLGKNADEWYAFLDGKESDEFLSEIMSNSQFRLALQLASTSLWDKIKALFTRIILGVKTSTKVSNITSEIYKLIDSINRDDINIYTNNLFNQLAKQKEEIVKDNIDDLLTKITKGLSQRLESIKRYNKRNIKNENELETLILDLSDKDGLQGTVEFIDHIHNSIDSSAKFLSKDLKDINYKLVRQLNEDYVGFYKPLLDLIKYNLDTTDMFKDLPELESFHNLVNQLSSEMNTINNKYNYVAKEKGILALVEKLKDTNTPQHYIDNIILWIKNPNNDGNFFSVWTGMSSESSNLVVQTIAKILNDTKNNTDRYVYEEGLKLLDYLLKAKEVHGIKAQSFLYEKLNDGTYSGYMVRDINYGLYRSDFRNHLDNVAKKLKITLDKDGKYILPEDEDITDKWYESIEDFYSKNTERRYTNDYYTLRNKILSSKSKAALDEINSRIKSILDTVTEENLVMEDLLTKELQQKLENLRRSKKLLGLEYNLDGTPKQGIDAIISKEIRKFNTEVGIDNKYLPDYEKFKSDEAKVIAKYGKDSKEHQTWVKNNTVTRYTLEFYDRIANLEKVELTKEYLDLYDKRRQLLSFYRDPKTLEVNVDELSDKDRRMLKQLDLDIADLFSFTDEDKTTDNNKDKFFNFAEITYTSQYYKDYKMAQEAGEQAFLEWFNDNHYEDFKGKLKPAHYYTKLTPKREVVEAYTETVPSGRYSKLDPQSKYFNHNFIEGGSSVLPKRSIYDNTANYNKVLKDVHLKALYDAIHNSIMKSNSLLSFMSGNDNYRMPLISAKTLLVISRSNGVLGALNYLLEDIATTKEDDTDYVEEFATKPNGEPLRMIPTRYIRMLKNTNNISTDAIASTLLYADMASNFYNMSQQRDLIETLLNLLKLASVTTKTEHKGIGSLNYYKQAQLLIDRLMYGREKTSLTFNIGNKEINAGKVLDLTRAWITKVNLSYNPWSAGTSTLTDLSYTTLEAFLGRYYTFDDINFAKTEFMSLLPYILSNVGNPKPNNKITYLMQLNLIVRDNREIYDRLDHSTAARALNLNFWFAGYTQSDYTVKGHVTVAIYHGYKYIKGEGFMNKNQYLNKYHSNDRKAGAIAFKQLPINLYDTYTQDKDGNFKVKDEYKLYVTEKLLNDVKNRIEVLTKRVDGTLRDVDKAKIHSNSITAYLSQHRNFMISALHNRLKGRMYNQDLGIEEEGYYRTMTRFLKNIIGNKHFALSQMLADYDNMEEYELYSVKKVLSELTMVASSTIVALTIAGLVDSDDDYDNWLLLATTYLALRSAFEFRSLYNPAELMSMIKSPTAAFSWFDHSLGILGIFNPFAYIYAKSTWSSIDRGVYKGLPKVMRNIIKITPAKNLMEMQDPKSKRNYLQNLLMTF